MLITIFIGALMLLVVWDYFRKKHRTDTLAKSTITGPTALPILGCGFEANKVNSGAIIPYVIECFEKYGKTFRLWLFGELLVYTCDIRLFETVLSSSTLLQKGDVYELLASFLNDGLLLSIGKKWHARRKIFTPAFHFKTLEHYVDVFDEQSGVLVQKLAKYADGRTQIELFEYVSLAALDVITEAAMGVKVNAQSDSNFPYVKALKSVVDVQANRLLHATRYPWVFLLTAPAKYRKLVNDIKTMHDFTIKVIKERRAELNRTIADGTYKPMRIADADIGSKQQMALLDILLQSTIDNKPLTNEEIREEVDTFMFEGDDTTTSAISHALHSIARHPHVQQKLFEEAIAVLGNDKDAPITMAQLNELKYMECVIKETLRLYPSVPAYGRKTLCDIKMTNDVVIPANTSVYLVPYCLHRNPEYFSEPESFKPERFEELAEDVSKKRNPYAYTPFSAGPKNCIGQKFAVLEMKAMLSKMLRHYELLPLGKEVFPLMNLILRSTTGANIGLKLRVY